MSRRAHGRLGLYYLILRGSEGRMFYGNEDYPAFIRVLDAVLAEARYRLHAYCLLPAQAHLAVQMSEIALADFSQRLALKFGRWMQQKYGHAASAPELARPPRLVDEDGKSRELIRLIHLLPLKSGLDPESYGWSGHRTYLGLARVSCLETRTGLHLFAQDMKTARGRYEEYIREGLAAVRSLRPRSSAAASEAGVDVSLRSLDDLIVQVAQLGGRAVADIRSGSRERLVSFLRAVITWHATRLEIATFGEVARYLRRDPSSLYAAMKRYAELYPTVFGEPGKLGALAALEEVKINGRFPLPAPQPSKRK